MTYILFHLFIEIPLVLLFVGSATVVMVKSMVWLSTLPERIISGRRTK